MLDVDLFNVKLFLIVFYAIIYGRMLSENYHSK